MRSFDRIYAVKKNKEPTLWLIAALSVGAGLLSGAAIGKETGAMVGTETVGTDRAFSYEVTTTASPDRVWALWTDVSTWKTWDKGLKDAELGEPMRRGSKGKITPLSGPSASFTVTEFDPQTSYTFATNLPLAKLTVRRTIIGTSPTRFRHDVSFSGPMGGVFAKRFGPGFRKALPPTMREIAALAESGASGAP
jgi:Polyketide cyclase / dehydrase and lipid transport